MRRHRFIVAFAALLVSFAWLVASAAVVSADPAGPQGVDTSGYQHPYGRQIDWAAVRDSGVTFAYIKAGGADPNGGHWCYPGTSYGADPWHSVDISSASAAGLVTGGYWFACPGGDPEGDGHTEARNAVAHGICDGSGLPPALDLESPYSNFDAAGTATFADTWLRDVTDACGKPAVIYTGAYFSWSAQSILANWALWVAAYGFADGPTGLAWSRAGETWSLWQWTSTGTYPGIASSNVDHDVAKQAWLNAVTGGTAPAPNTPAPPPIGTGTAVLRIGSRGPQVAALQRFIEGVGIDCGGSDGVFGKGTARCVAAFQARIGVAADGVWGPASQARLEEILAAVVAASGVTPNAGDDPPPPIVNRPTIHYHDGPSQDVCDLQALLTQDGAQRGEDGFALDQTCIDDDATNQVVIVLQRERGIVDDGVVGPETWRALGQSVPA